MFALFHFIYITSISIIKLWYGIKILRSDKLDVKNSPFCRFVYMTGKLLYCWKHDCQAGSVGLDLVDTSMLEAGNQEKFFTPLPIKSVKFIVNNKPANEILKKMLITFNIV